MVVQDVVNSALRLCGALDPGETPNASESADGFNRLNDILEELNLERTNLYTVQPTTLVLTNQKPSYQIGPGAADFPGSPRPLLIKGAGIIPAGTTIELPMGLIGSTEYQAINDKNALSVRPEKLYPDYQKPISTFYVWPCPVGSASIKLWAWQALAAFVTLQDVLAFPAGYGKLLQYMLAVDMAPDMKAQLDPLVIQIAAGAKQKIQLFNALLLGQSLDETTTGQIPKIGETLPPQQ